MSIKTASFYNRFSLFYPLVDVLLRPQKRILFNEINGLAFGQLLEIGVGNGAHLSLYKTHKITGIDTSSRMLEAAEKRGVKNVELLQMNGEALSFPDESFDYVVLSHVIAVVDCPEQLLEEVHRVLKADGKVYILNHFTPENWLKYIDRFFNGFAKILHLKSVFYIDDIRTMRKFRLLREINPGSYFKLLIYQKSEKA